jgi:hypothetical protein
MYLNGNKLNLYLFLLAGGSTARPILPPIMVDTSSPVTGEVHDGAVRKRDIDYQPNNDKICASWKDFYDPDSGIHRYVIYLVILFNFTCYIWSFLFKFPVWLQHIF